MRICLNNFNNDIYLSEDSINVLKIDNKKLFIKILEELYSYQKDIYIKDELSFYDNNQKEKTNQKINVITDFYNINFNSLTIQNKIIAILEENITLEFNEALNNTIKEFSKIISNIDLTFNYNNIEIKEFAKVLKLKIDSETPKIYEKILLLIDIYAELNIKEPIFFVNLSKYLVQKEQRELYKYIRYKKVVTLFIEDKNYEKISDEKILNIDNDFIEFLI